MIKRSELGNVPLTTSDPAADDPVEPELPALVRFGDDEEDSDRDSSSAQLRWLDVLLLRCRAGASNGGIVRTSQRSSSVEVVDIPDEKSEIPEREVREGGGGANNCSLTLLWRHRGRDMLSIYGPDEGVDARGTWSSIAMRWQDIGPSLRLAPMDPRRFPPRTVPLSLPLSLGGGKSTRGEW